MPNLSFIHPILRRHRASHIKFHTHAYIVTIGVVHLTEIKFGDLAANAD